MGFEHHDESVRDAMSQSFVYLVSPRGADCFYARILNACEKITDKEHSTLGVHITPSGKFVLKYNPEFFASLTYPLKKLVLVHEAGHLVLRHQERLFRMMAVITDPKIRIALLAIFNWAADFAVNDNLVRNEAEWATQKPWENNPKDLMERINKGEKLPEGTWAWLLPEHFNLPKDKSYEYYLGALMQDAQTFFDAMEKLMGKGDGSDGDGSDGDGSGSEGGTSPGKGKSGGSSKSGEGVPSELRKLAEEKPGLFQKMLEAYARHTGDNHKDWVKVANEMTADEAERMANCIKKESKRLVRTAYAQTMKTRGSLPGAMAGLIDSFMKDDQVPWHGILKEIIQAQVCSKMQEVVGPPNLAMINNDHFEPFPGYSLDFAFNIIWMDDTSGSVSDVEFARGRATMNALMQGDKNIKLRNIQCDYAIQHEEETDNLQEAKPAEDLIRHGYGGTSYVPAFKRILGVDEDEDWVMGATKCDEPPPKPDLIIVVTDGGVCIEGELFPKYRPPCPIIWLVTPNNQPAPGMNNVPPDIIVQMHAVTKEDE